MKEIPEAVTAIAQLLRNLGASKAEGLALLVTTIASYADAVGVPRDAVAQSVIAVKTVPAEWVPDTKQ